MRHILALFQIRIIFRTVLFPVYSRKFIVHIIIIYVNIVVSNKINTLFSDVGEAVSRDRARYRDRGEARRGEARRGS